jgi:hypothetical protein
LATQLPAQALQQTMHVEPRSGHQGLQQSCTLRFRKQCVAPALMSLLSNAPQSRLMPSRSDIGFDEDRAIKMAHRNQELTLPLAQKYNVSSTRDSMHLLLNPFLAVLFVQLRTLLVASNERALAAIAATLSDVLSVRLSRAALCSTSSWTFSAGHGESCDFPGAERGRSAAVDAPARERQLVRP